MGRYGAHWSHRRTGALAQGTNDAVTKPDGAEARS
jgi:hypothetical protein